MCEEGSSNSSNVSHHQLLAGNSDPCAHVVHVLLCYHQGGEDPEFIRKAIESLVKKLKGEEVVRRKTEKQIVLCYSYLSSRIIVSF
jgi:hypothetical protein